METDTPPPTEPTTKSRKRGIYATLKGLLFTLAVLTTLWFALRYVLTPLVLPKDAPPADISEQDEGRLKALEDRVAALENAKPGETSIIDVAPLEARIVALENQIPAEGNAVSSEAIDALKAELAAVKTSNHATLKSIILVGQLQEAVRTGRPYSNELNALSSLRPDLAETLAPLQAHGATGIATLAQLQEQFARAISPALSPGDMGKSFTQNLRSLVKIRKVGENQQGEDDQAVIARAEAKLMRGDITASAQEIGTLSPRAAQNFAPWLERAEARLSAEAALQKLQAGMASGAGE